MHFSFYVYALSLFSGWIFGTIVRHGSQVPGFLDDGI